MIRICNIIPVFILTMLAACNSGQQVRTDGTDDTINVTRAFARRFAIEKKEGYSILSIMNPWQGASNVVHKFYLVNRGAPRPEGMDLNDIIEVPVKSIVCMSTTYLPMIRALGAEESITGISGPDLIYDDKISSMVKSGRIADVGYEDNLNKELLIRLKPELLMVYGVGSEAAGYMNKVRDLGVKIIFNADYLETDPLAKAEWIKVFGALYDREQEAEEIFSGITKRYLEIKEYVGKNISYKPKVLMGLPWKDTWFISPGNSFSSTIISDAGGEYLWKDVISEVSIPMGVENVWYKAMGADFWLNPGTALNIAGILALDGRLAELPCVRNENIFNNNNRIRTDVGNDYWESGVIKPDVILKDIASILHPELFPGYVPVYYRKVNKQ